MKRLTAVGWVHFQLSSGPNDEGKFQESKGSTASYVPLQLPQMVSKLERERERDMVSNGLYAELNGST